VNILAAATVVTKRARGHRSTRIASFIALLARDIRRAEKVWHVVNDRGVNVDAPVAASMARRTTKRERAALPGTAELAAADVRGVSTAAGL